MIQASGFGIVVIHPPTKHTLIDLWPCYLYLTAPQCSFSPTALKHYLQLHSVLTEHTVHLAIRLADDHIICFPSRPRQVKDSRLDYFSADIMLPCPPKSVSVSIKCAAPVLCLSKAPTLTHALFLSALPIVAIISSISCVRTRQFLASPSTPPQDMF
jgi:hypothetical protein